MLATLVRTSHQSISLCASRLHCGDLISLVLCVTARFNLLEGCWARVGACLCQNAGLGRDKSAQDRTFPCGILTTQTSSLLIETSWQVFAPDQLHAWHARNTMSGLSDDDRGGESDDELVQERITQVLRDARPGACRGWVGCLATSYATRRVCVCHHVAAVVPQAGRTKLAAKHPLPWSLGKK